MKRKVITSILILILAIIMFPLDTVASGIIDYKPSSYIELADEPFFYSIGKTLRYGRTISESSPVLFKGLFFKGDLVNVFVSPDNKKAAIVSGGKLYLAETTGNVYLLLEKVGGRSYKFQQEEAGEVFYDYNGLQWDVESRSIYIVRDKKKVPTPHSCWRSPDAALVRIDIESPNKIIEVIKDFNSLDYFFAGKDTICFNYALGNGDVLWKCSQNGNARLVISHQHGQMVLENGIVTQGRPFLSYRPNIYESQIWLSNYGFSLKRSAGDITDFFSKSDSRKPIFKIQGGHNIKGHYVNGISQTGCKVLPGGRYALLNVWHDKFKGQLLVDGLTGKYRELPTETRVYLNLNSLNYEHFKFDIGPTKHPEFVPSADLAI